MNNIKDIIYIFLFIIIFCLCMKKNNLERFTQELTLDNFRKIMTDTYKVDIDSIRNLSEVANSLQSGGLTVPGNLKVLGKLTVDKDSSLNSNLYVKDYTSSKRLDVRNSESVAGRGWTHFNYNNTGVNYTRGKLQTDQGDIRFNGNISSNGSFTTDSYITAKGDINAGNNITLNNSHTKFIIHNPNDARPELWFAKHNGSDWNWGKGMNFNGDTGTLRVFNNTKVDKTLTIGGAASRHGNTVGAISFNYNNDGRNYITGDTVIRPQKTVGWNGDQWKNYMHDVGAIVGDRSFVIYSGNDGWKMPMELNRTTHNGHNRISASKHADHHHNF